MHDRGQTPQDYVVGIMLMLVTLSGVFFVVPGIFDPFVDPVDNSERAMADAAADYIVERFTINHSERTLDFSALEGDLDDETEVEDIKTKSGIPEDKRLNVNLTTEPVDPSDGDDEVIQFDGVANLDTTDDQVAIATRIVDTDEGQCKRQVCRLIVRVW